jgi:hypothetical protein
MQFSLTAVSILILGSLALVGVALVSLIVLILRDSKNKDIW